MKNPLSAYAEIVDQEMHREEIAVLSEIESRETASFFAWLAN